MVGRLVMHRFRVSERLGEGGFGTVWRAWDERLDRPVAVKEIAGGGRARVLREAQAAARLNHPSIVTLYELGEESGRALLVTELVTGRTLRELCASQEVSDRGIGDAGAELFAALDHAHRRAVVHRDIKPDNIALQDDPLPGSVGAKLIDFGVARLEDQHALTATGEVVGTIAYMAPEQAEGERAGPPADVYALGLTLYEAWAGRNPVVGVSPAATARAIGKPAPSLAVPRPDLPARLIAAIDACLDPDPAARPDPSAVRRALAASAPVLDPSRPVPAPSSVDERAGPAGLRRSRARALAIASASAASLLALVFGLPGLALLTLALVLPPLLVAGRPREWALPALAPLLGMVDLGIAYAAVAALGGTVVARAGLAFAGAAWIAVVAGVSGGAGALPEISPPPGWEAAAGATASGLLAPILESPILSYAILLPLAAVVLGLIAHRLPLGVAILASICWAAALLAVTRALGMPEPGYLPVALAAASLGVVATVRRLPRSPRPAPRVRAGLRGDDPRRPRAAATAGVGGAG